jgi:opacity protein-like surface antigen
MAMKKVFLGLAITLWTAAAAPAQLVSFQLTGGLTWINGDDYNQGLTGLNRYLQDTSSSLAGAYELLDSGLNVQVEIINWFTPHIGVGLGGGYYRVSRENTVSGGGLASGMPYDFRSTYSARVSAIPFFLNLHVLVRPLPMLSLDVFAGPVFQVVQFNFENPMTLSLDSTNQVETFTASQTSLGGQAGLGLNFDLFPGVSLVAAGGYRFGRVSNLQGNWSVLGTSALGPINLSSSVYDLWYYEFTQGATYPRFGFFDDNGPSGAGISGARRADINLSGLTVSAGVKFSF